MRSGHVRLPRLRPGLSPAPYRRLDSSPWPAFTAQQDSLGDQQCEARANWTATDHCLPRPVGSGRTPTPCPQDFSTNDWAPAHRRGAPGRPSPISGQQADSRDLAAGSPSAAVAARPLTAGGRGSESLHGRPWRGRASVTTGLHDRWHRICRRRHDWRRNNWHGPLQLLADGTWTTSRLRRRALLVTPQKQPLRHWLGGGGANGVHDVGEPFGREVVT